MIIDHPHKSVGITTMVYVPQFIAVDGGIQRLSIPQLYDGNTFIELAPSISFFFRDHHPAKGTDLFPRGNLFIRISTHAMNAAFFIPHREEYVEN